MSRVVDTILTATGRYRGALTFGNCRERPSRKLRRATSMLGMSGGNVLMYCTCDIDGVCVSFGPA